MHTKIRHADHTVKTGLISFSEGTRFTLSKYASSINWCKEHNHLIMKHILYPRVRGFVATVSALRHTKHVRAVCDMTIAYAHGNNFMQAPSSWQTIPTADLAKEGYKFYIHDGRYDTNELPESGLSKWLKERWIKKGERLEMLRDKLAVERNEEEDVLCK